MVVKTNKIEEELLQYKLVKLTVKDNFNTI